jgi:3-dehydroquinate dehydratase / shikimate dehydrogenase
MGVVKLCVTVTGQTMADLRKRRDEVADADLVELRVDTVADPSAAGALAGRRTPVIFTCRPAWEGGQFKGSEDERRRLLRDAQQLGAEYVDVEWRAGFTELLDRSGGHGVVLSMHDFAGVPADLASQATAMRATGVEVIKIAVMAHRLSDCLPLWTLGRNSTSPTALVAMGEAGVASRVLARHFRSCWTYAGDAIAPGQVPVARLRDEWSFRKITERTAVYGVVGRPVTHSVSPAMHNAAFRAGHIDAVYIPFAAADFDDFLKFADQIGVVGASVTAPFKRDASDRANDCDALSRRTRSVNTLRRSGDRWIGANTDVAGFLEPLQARMSVRGARATILGAGGAARSAAEALNSAAAQVSIAARHQARAEETAALVGCAVSNWPPLPHSWDILVNATPIGTAPAVDESPLPEGPFTGQWVYDLVYNPTETTLLRAARAAGCRTLGGLDMLVAQAQRQFEWWTGLRPSERVMREAALRALQGA